MTVVKFARSLERNHRARVVDVVIIGSIIYLISIISDIIKINPMTLSGILTFIYGFIILIYYKFREGLKERKYP